MFAFPVLLLALLFVAVCGPAVTTEIVAVGIGSAPGYARMVRGQVLAVRRLRLHRGRRARSGTPGGGDRAGTCSPTRCGRWSS